VKSEGRGFLLSERSGYLEDDPLWYKQAVIYEVHVKAFYDSDGDGIGDFKGLTSKLDYLEELGVTAIWLLPFYPSPMRDDGYDISDYLNIHTHYGTIKDFKKLLREAHKKGIRVITELVLNHTSDQHPWFQKSRRSTPGSIWRDFYVWSPTPNKYSDARVIFKDFEPSNWTWDPLAKAYYWHRFYSHQPDLNYNNPHVQKAILDVLDFWLSMGVDGVRLDAVPYLFEREGTSCENLPETHEFLKRLRRHVDENFKNKMLLAEANQWPSDAAAYFGEGDECHMAFHFPLMPRMFMAIQLEDNFPIMEIFEHTPPIPENCQWALFLRNHDELTLEMVTDEERDYMYRAYAKDKQARINLGIRRRLAPLLGNDRRKIELMNILLFTLPGTPVIYYGDEIGMGDNYSLGDRNGVRTPMQWSADINAGFSRTNPQRLYLPVIIDPEYHYEAVNVENQLKNQNSLLWWMRRLISLRKRFKAFGYGTIEFLYPENNKVVAFIRQHEDERLLVVVNLSRYPQLVELDLSQWDGCIPLEVFGGTRFPPIGRSPYILTFDPYGYYIFSIVKEEAAAIPPVTTKPELHLEKRLEDLFRNKPKEKLETIILPAFIKGCRWFGGKAREIELVRIRDRLPIDIDRSRSLHLVIFDVYYNEGLPDTYLIPIAYASGEEAKQIDASHPEAVIARVTIRQEEGLIYDGVFDEDCRRALLQLIVRRRSAKGRSGELIGSPRGRLKRLIGFNLLNLKSNVLQVEQSNTSIVYEDRVMLKIFRRVDEGANPELEIGDALTKSGFPNTPQILGDISYMERGAEPMVVAMLVEFVKNEGDAWELCLDELTRYFDRVVSLGGGVPEESSSTSILDLAYQGVPQQYAYIVGVDLLNLMSLLGRRTGEFHLALLSLKDRAEFTPEPFNYLYQIALSQSMISYAKRVLRRAARSRSLEEGLQTELERILSHQDLLIGHLRAVSQRRMNAIKMRVHGDYHLGQVLYTGDDFVIIDFEGEPERSLSERRLKRSPLRDVAGMVRSLHYAAYSALLKRTSVKGEGLTQMDRWADLWYRCTAAAFLKSYLETVTDSQIVPEDRVALRMLLEAFILEKAVYELGYELNNRPDWAVIPIKGIRSLLDI